jgi:hypothetical protein
VDRTRRSRSSSLRLARSGSAFTGLTDTFRRRTTD